MHIVVKCQSVKRANFSVHYSDRQELMAINPLLLNLMVTTIS